MPPRRQSPQKREQPSSTVLVALNVIRFFTTLVEKYGWPGAVLIVLFVGVQFWASGEQKHELVDMYILGKGMVGWWPLVVPSMFFVLVIWAQALLAKRKIRELKGEMKRIATEKSSIQEDAAGRKLQHARDLEGD